VQAALAAPSTAGTPTVITSPSAATGTSHRSAAALPPLAPSTSSPAPTSATPASTSPPPPASVSSSPGSSPTLQPIPLDALTDLVRALLDGVGAALRTSG